MLIYSGTWKKMIVTLVAYNFKAWYKIILIIFYTYTNRKCLFSLKVLLMIIAWLFLNTRKLIPNLIFYSIFSYIILFKKTRCRVFQRILSFLAKVIREYCMCMYVCMCTYTHTHTHIYEILTLVFSIFVNDILYYKNRDSHIVFQTI